MTTCIMFTLWPVCAAFSFLRQQAVHFEFRSVSLFRALHPFWSGSSSSRAATNCVERTFSPGELPNVLHESFFGRVQAPRTRAGALTHMHCPFGFAIFNLSSPAPPTPWSPNTFSEMASVCIIPCYSNLCELQCNFWRPVCGQNSVSLQKLRSGGLTYVQLFTRLPGPPG